ncbi:hypothetical protein L5M43_06265 [Shewanella sp. SW36]|uniref:hypothetical protein n=1 Tax=unclassified Shewanella TaxID=196818 RepID=UPI0021DB3643|nr:MULTISPECIES: hypothetical protein [unclassified Shewanella]MCU7974883.1 hypothetical protein [Shewanella sp. SW36]MCU7990272.1 hypothetical protein [Shewanella sp. SW1]MCU8052730.1 hypothetical protein [Shewanella sp. SM43]
MNEPIKISAGTTVSWSFNHALANSGWQFRYALRGPGAIDIDASTSDGVVIVKQMADVTSAWIAGQYEWRLYATLGADRQVIGSGQITIEADFSQLSAGHDPRSHAKRMLDAINTVLEGRILSDHESYTINDRRLDRIPIKELYVLRRSYIRKIRQENGVGFQLKRIRSRLPG